MPDKDILPNPLVKRLPKAPRDSHPGEPTPTASTTTPAASNSNRVGPNRVRKSLYLPADIAQELSEAANRIHHQSNGRISKAEAAGALIKFGLTNLTAVHKHLHITN
ncbi:MAG: hypothetical protein M3Y49_13600 [Actinomycetota bacterium]|nr:hypothetical protein [Actinomycetota bacterium]